MAAFQWQVPACRKVAIVSGLLLAATAVGLIVFYVPPLRRLTGFDFLLRRMPMQRLVHTAVQGLEMYGHDHPKKTLLALLLCFPVHVTTIVSATLAGHAFGLHDAAGLLLGGGAGDRPGGGDPHLPAGGRRDGGLRHPAHPVARA